MRTVRHLAQYFAIVGGLQLVTACFAPATVVIVAVDTDIPRGRGMLLDFRVTREGGPPIGPVPPEAGAGRYDYPFSFGVHPTSAALRMQRVQVDFSVELPSRNANEPLIRFRRSVRFSYTPNRTGIVRVFLPLRCAETALGCPADGEACTVARLCELAGLTCGNNGECVGIDNTVTDYTADAEMHGFEDRPSAPIDRFDVVQSDADAAVTTMDGDGSTLVDDGTAMDADGTARDADGTAMDAQDAFDVGNSSDSADVSSTDVPNNDVPNNDVPSSDVPNRDVPNNDVSEACMPNCAGRVCGSNGCGGQCGPACPGGANATGVCSMGGSCGLTCNANFANCNNNNADGCEVNLNTDDNNCGFCGRLCGPGLSCNSGACRPMACVAPQQRCGAMCFTFGQACGMPACPLVMGFEASCRGGLPICGLRCDNGVIVCGSVGVEGQACLGTGTCRANGQCACDADPGNCLECGMCSACGTNMC